MTVFARIEVLLGQWERAAPLPPYARHLLRKLARRIVLDAAAVCRARSLSDRPQARKNEAVCCADQLTHALLCGEGQSVCLKCDGEGCRACAWAGVRGELEERT